MSIYADANILVRLYLEFEGAEVRDMLNTEEAVEAWPLPVTDILRCEVINAFQRMVFESRNGGFFRTSPEAAAAATANFEEDLNAGVFLKRVTLPLRGIEEDFDALVGRHTARHGFRTYDILHVASAMTLQCGRFYSFDQKANELARLEGLQTH